jgi:hypothetical protein
MQLINLPANYSGPSIGYVRATIKIAHPDWSPEAIEAELQKKMQELMDPANVEGCDFCSS